MSPLSTSLRLMMAVACEFKTAAADPQQADHTTQPLQQVLSASVQHPMLHPVLAECNA